MSRNVAYHLGSANALICRAVSDLKPAITAFHDEKFERWLLSDGMDPEIVAMITQARFHIVSLGKTIVDIAGAVDKAIDAAARG